MANLQNLVFVGLTDNPQDLDGNLLVFQQSPPNIPKTTCIYRRISSQFNTFECHAFWVQAGVTRQLNECTSVVMFE